MTTDERCAQLRSEILSLLCAMNEALDKQRWRRMPGLHQRLMTLFAEYSASERSAAALEELKLILRQGFQSIIERRTQRAALLEARMASHRSKKEGMLAYSMVGLVSEQS